MGLLLLLLMGMQGGAQAQGTLSDVTFSGNVSQPAAGGQLGTTGLYDLKPSWQVVSSILVTTGSPGYNNAYLVSQNDVCQDQSKDVYFTAGSTTDVVAIHLRWSGTSTSGNSYLFYCASGLTYMNKLIANSATSIGSWASLTWVAGHNYKLTARASGVSPTSLTMSLTDLTTATTYNGNSTFTDSTALLQTASNASAIAYGLGSAQAAITRITDINLSGTAAATSYAVTESATSGAAGAAVTLTYAPSGTSTAVVTPSVSGVTGTFSPATITFSGVAAQVQTFTPSSTGTATFSFANSATLTNPANLGYAVGSSVAVNAADSHLYYGSNAWFANGGTLQTANAGNALKFGFTSTVTSNITATFDLTPLTGGSVPTGYYPQIAYALDGGAPVTTILSASTMTLFTGVSAGAHNVWFMPTYIFTGYDRWGTGAAGPANCLRLTQFTLPAQSITSAPSGPYAVRPNDTLIFGDSTLPPDVGSGTTDAALHSWSQYVGAALDSEVAVIGFGAQGFNSPGLTNVPVFSTAYASFDNIHSRLSAGRFIKQPNTIIVVHGINDRGQGASSTSKTNAQAVMGSLRSAAPSAKIFYLVPWSQNGIVAADGATLFQAGLTAAFNAYQSVTPDANSKLIDFATANPDMTSQFLYPGVNMTDYFHPNSTGYSLVGAYVGAEIKKALASTTPTAPAKRRLQ